MPIQYERDDAERRIKLTITDPFTVAELIAAIERQLAEGAWRYGLLVDARAMLAARPPGDTSLLSRVGELVAAHGPRGPIAVITREPGTIATTQRYIFFSEGMEPIEVFWDLADAQQWLDDRMAPDRQAPASD
jgi:hypothetical protein